MRRIDITGQRFGKLVAKNMAPPANGRSRWECICDCGRTTTVLTENLRSSATGKNSRSCGMCRKATPASFKPKHGAATKKGPTYNSWRAMRRRISRPDRSASPVYGKIDIDPAWGDFAVFLQDMGERPAGMTLDRVDNSKGYSKENCRWATPVQQTRNRTNSVVHTEGGVTLPIAEWARLTGTDYYTMYWRIRRCGSVRELQNVPKLGRVAS